ncbi:WD40 repeat domain-containing protein [Nocardia goodfellowii]|uniref:WD40 repeat protein n=1 Tax=Nocardia goodfellowii TaxID=882446 RepID=A0ABS4QPB7_9NOCA|nr:WD40 repeat domain-containing protein [Nocardia goodfellowii]MBP2192980.1 WD40 repeat protein [Nocardia goodfellowii]
MRTPGDVLDTAALDFDVRVLALAPDGGRVVAAGTAVAILDARTLRPLWQVPAIGTVRTVRFGPDGSRILTFSTIDDEHHQVRLLDAANGGVLATSDVPTPITVSGGDPENPVGSAFGLLFAGAIATGILRKALDGTARSLAFSPDGRHFAGPLGVFDGADGHRRFALPGLTEPAGAVVTGPLTLAFSPDSHTLVAGWHRAVRSMTAATGAVLWTHTQPGKIGRVWFGTDGRVHVLCTPSQDILTLNAATGAVESTVRLDLAITNPMFFIPFPPHAEPSVDRRQLTVFGATRMTVFDLADGTRRFEPIPYQSPMEGPPVHTQLAPQGDLVALNRIPGAATGIMVVRTGSGASVWQDPAPINDATFTAAPRRLLVGGDRMVRAHWIGPVQLAPISRLDHGGAVRAVAFAPDGGSVATACADSTARVFDRTTGTELRRFDHRDGVTSISYHPGGALLLTGSADGFARGFDLTDGTEAFRLRHEGAVTAILALDDGNRAISGSADATLRIIDLNSSTVTRTIQLVGAVECLAVSSDSTMVAVGAADSTARLYHLGTGQPLLTLNHDAPVRAVAFSRDGTRLATAGGRTAFVTEIASGDPQRTVTHSGPLHTVSFHPDGVHLLTAGATARITDLRDGATTLTITHDAPIHAAAFPPDGSRVATAGADAAGHLTEYPGGAELFALPHDSAVDALAFDHSGTHLATAASRSARVFSTI